MGRKIEEKNLILKRKKQITYDGMSGAGNA